MRFGCGDIRFLLFALAFPCKAMPDLVHGNAAERQACGTFKLSNIHSNTPSQSQDGCMRSRGFTMVPGWHEQMSIICKYIMYISTKQWQGQ
jgi:hypothetical protein